MSIDDGKATKYVSNKLFELGITQLNNACVNA